MSEGRQPSATVDIAGEPYLLAKSAQGVPEFHPRQVQTQEGDPTVPRRYRWNDWSRGMGDSRGVFKGAIESASNAYLGSIGRILPGPKVTTVETNHDTAITAIVEVTAPAARLITFGGRYAKEVDASWSVAATNDFGAGKNVAGAVLFVDQVAIAMGDAVQFQRRDASGAYAASTVTSDSYGDYRYARAFGLSPEGDLVRGRGAKWSKCSAADFYATNGNWSAEYSIGDASGNINYLGNFERWDYVLKDEGLYTFDSEQSKESNVLPDLAAWRSSTNRRWFAWYNRLFLCTSAGLYRYIQGGGARTVGIEEAELNEGILQDAYPTAGVAFGKWAYVAYYDPALATTSVILMRNARDGDASFGAPFTAVSVIDSFSGQCLAMTVTNIAGYPAVCFARDTDLSYFKVSRSGRPAEFRDSGSLVVTFSPNDLGTPMTVKYARSLEVVGRNLSAARNAQFACSWDGGAYNNVDSALTSLSASFARASWALGSNDSGRVPQLKVTLGLDSASTPPEVRDVVLNYEERPVMVPGAVMLLRFVDGDREGPVSPRKSALERRQVLEALLDGAPVSFTDPYGSSYTAALAEYQGDITGQSRGLMPEDVVAVTVRSLEYA